MIKTKALDVVTWMLPNGTWEVGIYVKSASDSYPGDHWVQTTECCKVAHVPEHELVRVGTLMEGMK